ARDARAVVGAEVIPFTAGVGGRAGQSAPTAGNAPIPTVTGKADRVVGAAYLASPAHSKTTGRGRYFDSGNDPLKSITATNDKAAVVAELTASGQAAGFTIPRYGERDGQAPRSRSLDKPSPVVTPTSNGAQLAAVALTKHYTGVIGTAADRPIDSITGV